MPKLLRSLRCDGQRVIASHMVRKERSISYAICFVLSSVFPQQPVNQRHARENLRQERAMELRSATGLGLGSDGRLELVRVAEYTFRAQLAVRSEGRILVPPLLKSRP